MRLKELEKKYGELEKKYEELGNEIEKIRNEQDIVKTDPIYLMSVDEYKKYKDKIPEFSCWWWLRSSSCSSNCATLVPGYGGVSDSGSIVGNDSGCVRPVLNLKNTHNISCTIKRTKSGNNFLNFCGILWKEIDTNLFIAEVPIATHRFDKKSNNYSNSEIRKFLLDWYEDRRYVG